MIVNRLSVSASTLLLFCGLQMTSSLASEGEPAATFAPFQVAQANPAEDQKAREKGEKKPEKKPEPQPQQQQRQQPAPPQQQQRQAPPPQRQAPPAAERREQPQQQKREAPPERKQVQPERRPEPPPRREVQPERKAQPSPPPPEKRVPPTPEKRDPAPAERRANPTPPVPAGPATAPKPVQQAAPPVPPKLPETKAPSAVEQRQIDRRAAPSTPTPSTPPPVVNSAPAIGSPIVPPPITAAPKIATPPPGIAPAPNPGTTPPPVVNTTPAIGSPVVPPPNVPAPKTAAPPSGVAPSQPPATTAQPLKPGAPPIAGAAIGVGVAAGAVAGAAAAGALAPPVPKAPEATAAPQKFEDVQKSRQQRVEDGGRRTVIQEGNRIIIKQDNRIIIQHDEGERFRRVKDSQTQRRPDGIVETFYVRPDGFRVVSEVDGSGRLLRRYRRGTDGREFGIIDNRRFYRNTAIGVGLGAIAIAIALNIAAPRIIIPRERYIVDYDRASDDDLYEALTAPPVERLERSYSLEEVRYSYELREHMRRVDLNDVTFAFGAYEVTQDQYGKLERLARSILRALRENPEEVFLVEGHTDAVGSDVDNLSLSDRRASAVAQVLSETFGVPPENLVTQGYGEQYLKVKTQDAERTNRRVAVRRITPLMAEK